MRVYPPLVVFIVLYLLLTVFGRSKFDVANNGQILSVKEVASNVYRLGKFYSRFICHPQSY